MKSFFNRSYSFFNSLKSWQKIALVTSLAFIARLAFGVCSEFWADDEKQIYLLGLKYYSTGLWPYYGPDVVYTSSQIPGALQGLLVGIPLYLFPVPEAPFVLLNLISVLALSFFAWYCTHRTPAIPKWFIWAWLLSSPWTLNYSTYITNPSYVLAGGILFFVAVFELLPMLSINLISKPLAFFLLGFSVFWIAQLHMSWPVLLPFIAFAFYFLLREKLKIVILATVFFMAGCLFTGSLLLPTLLHATAQTGLGGTSSNIHFDPKNVLNIFTVVLRFLSFASFEITRFIGLHTKERLAFMSTYFWSVPFLIFAGIIGVAQVFALIYEFFKPKKNNQWKAIKYVTLVSCLFIYGGFLFSVKGPSSHTFYVFLPLAMIYSFHCFEHYFENLFWRKVALAFIVSGLVVHLAIGIDNFKTKSLYTNRAIPLEAIQKKEYHILGTRRAEQWGCCY